MKVVDVRLSIIIPSLNQAKYLRQNLHSILTQPGALDLQVIVMDGGSRDGTLDLLRNINDSRVTWASEPDRGQAHAINKGLARAQGDIVTWLNSDDVYLPGTLMSVVQAFVEHPSAQWVIGPVQIIDDAGREIRRPISRYKERRLRRYSFQHLLIENFIPQMSVFWRPEFAAAVVCGPGQILDESLHYCMDYDLWLRMARRMDPLILQKPLSQFRLHPQSKSGQVCRRQFDEEYEVACRYTDDRLIRLRHRLNVEMIVWAYRLMRVFGL